MNFKEISLEDRETIEAFTLRYGAHICDFTFADLYCWRQSYKTFWCIEQGFLVIKYLFDEVHFAYSQPLGEGDFSKIIPLIEADCEGSATPTFFAVTQEAAEMMAKIRPQWGFYHERSRSDYIYRREALVELAGKKYQPKRNHIHKFSSLYEWEYRRLSGQDKAEAMALLKRWQQDRLVQEGISDFYKKEIEDEELCIESAFDSYESLGITGGSIWVKHSAGNQRGNSSWQMEAFCYGSMTSEDTFCIHIEKGNENLDGIYSVINREFAAHLPSDVIFINREEDMGLGGLRKSKESYHPDHLLHKLVSFPLTPVMQQVRELWLKCFPDDSHLDAELFLATRFREENMLCHRENGVIVSMLHIIAFGDKAYIYAVGTDPKWRGRGIAKSIIFKAIEQCKANGFSLVCLIPENEPLKEWYSAMGFSGDFPTLFHTDDEYDFFTILPSHYDYGTGNISTDRAMAICLTDKPIEDFLTDGKLLLDE